MSTHYQLQIWNGSEYAGQITGQPDELRTYFRDWLHLDYVGYRIVDTLARDQAGTQLPMTGKANWASSNRRRLDDGLSVEAQAQAAADHYIKLRVRDLGDHFEAGILTQVPVFPVKPSGRGVAAEFRTLLARILTKQAPLTGGSFWAKNADETRRILEGRLVEAGYQFIEVDVEDYV